MYRVLNLTEEGKGFRSGVFRVTCIHILPVYIFSHGPCKTVVFQTRCVEICAEVDSFVVLSCNTKFKVMVPSSPSCKAYLTTYKLN